MQLSNAMKKNRDADELATRIAAAANQPAAVLSAPEPVLGSSQGVKEATAGEQRIELQRKPKTIKQPDADTVPISLRPERTLLNRYIIAASERTRAEGRVISAQQIMLEVLERSGV